MINTSEHLKRPKDMLMFLGEYFKQHIQKCNKIINSNQQTKSVNEDEDQIGEKPTELKDFYITYEILNQLATACKLFIEKPR